MKSTARVNAVRQRTSDWYIPYLFIAPAFVCYTVFLVYPMASSLYISFFRWDGLSPEMVFVGLDNYVTIFVRDEVARLALWNNVVWTIASLVVPTGIGLAFALALNRGLRGTTLFRTVFYAPAVLPLAAVGLIWSWMYNAHFGVINIVLEGIGLARFAGNWLSGHDTALAAVFVTYVWSHVGFPMMLYLAGLQAISRDLYEAALIDGASPWQSFRHVTLPGLSETTFIVLSLAVIQALKVFDIIYTMTYGGPGRSTQVLGTWMYFQAFQYYNAGYGSAIAWVIAVIILVIATPYITRMARS
ncbi:carbohydrate ABC transporter permease [Marinivivus vitaminiproducens]|uniref:carbohydrate ABC transporter permease n=1 Tax=Marinivivus vitaminiproducens TaxID=3035935 RepID=UPI00279D59A9|nr:sugar ABC transporter permease [Geminicoccaceae bacterium SCSIO 64248]